MNPTITKEIKKYFITDTIGYNLVAFLINMPSLGVTNSPTNDQLLLRENLIMSEAVAQELTDSSYNRQTLNINPEDIIFTASGKASLEVTASFSTTVDNEIGPFTHVVWARGASNTKGSTNGIIWKVEPVTAAPLTINYPVTFTTTTDVSITT